ncbi:hypothetical protein Dimus_039361 [Dionaea muscipula]
MGCLEMYNNNSEHKGHTGSGAGAPMSPRISFSNDFVEAQYSQGNIIKQEMGNRGGPVSSDFEFSVSGDSMMTADELFSKGRLLPLKQRAPATTSSTTLRDELLVDDDDDENVGGGEFSSLKPPKGSTRWRGFLGLKKSQIGSKKAEKNDRIDSMESSSAEKSAFSDEASNVRKLLSQEDEDEDEEDDDDG